MAFLRLGRGGESLVSDAYPHLPVKSEGLGFVGGKSAGGVFVLAGGLCASKARQKSFKSPAAGR